jgi:glucose-1-phosphate adenylyltransferase
MRPMKSTLVVILGGGRGSRLHPLTLHRSKPAVPVGGKYRLIDVPVSNCLNSELRRIYVLTQFNSESLNNHLSLTYKFDVFSSDFVSLLAAEQTVESPDWFLGTADAVRRSMRHLNNHHWQNLLILSGDQLYQMDYREMLETHRTSAAAATVAVKPVPAEQTGGFGILKVDGSGRLVHFEEKPGPERLPELVSKVPGVGETYLASMGIYIFTKPALERLLGDPELVDFGKHLIPRAVPELHVQAHVHEGYWEDVGTIRSYYQANIDLCESVPQFDFYDVEHPIYTRPRFLPATKIGSCSVKHALVSEGCILVGAEVERSIIGIRSRIGRGTRIQDSLVLGADFYETLDELRSSSGKGRPAMGIGEDCEIRNAIIDTNARVGRGVRILNQAGDVERDGPGYAIRDGITVITKNAVIPHGTVI